MRAWGPAISVVVMLESWMVSPAPVVYEAPQLFTEPEPPAWPAENVAVAAEPLAVCTVEVNAAVAVDPDGTPGLSLSVGLTYPDLQWLRISDGYAARFEYRVQRMFHLCGPLARGCGLNAP